MNESDPQQKFKTQLHLLKVPANEREANIIAIYAVLINEQLIGHIDNVPNIFLQIKSIIENINLNDGADIAKSLCLIKEKIEDSNENYTNKNIADIISAFSKKNNFTFRQIRNELAQSNAEIKSILNSYD
ncbi:hypothetical protein [Legionella cincinnatiensis]|uniref:Ankyrin repeat protein n=1 Tax=Legionella cincinnatiensis TaxID=28085 RepID=A0A378IFK8_9GAMM|nr:hypothetical protein [Legionella cincinnatiensis]KTC92171.1 ankyrin repeat protein [Legionella cincinnatiensis]STX33525.1 ankyrin repeat protein [Legionella cincinnatiensis]